MLIRCITVASERDLEQACEKQPGVQDEAVYAARDARLARQLAAHGLPCIYVLPYETPDGEITATECTSAMSARKDGGEGDVPGAALVLYEEDEEWQTDAELLREVWERHYGVSRTIAETARLLLRESAMEDLPAFMRMYAQEKENPDVKPLSETPQEELLAYIKNRYPFFGYGLWSVVLKGTGEVIGRVGFEERTVRAEEAQGLDGPEDGCADVRSVTLPELSYMIAAKHRGQGYAYEAAQAALAYARERLGFAQAALFTSERNHASQKLAQRLGFRQEELRETQADFWQKQTRTEGDKTCAKAGENGVLFFRIDLTRN